MRKLILLCIFIALAFSASSQVVLYTVDTTTLTTNVVYLAGQITLTNPTVPMTNAFYTGYQSNHINYGDSLTNAFVKVNLDLLAISNYISTNALSGGGGGFASNAIANLNGVGTNTYIYSFTTTNDANFSGNNATNIGYIVLSENSGYSQPPNVLSISSERNGGGVGGINIGYNNGQIYGELWTAVIGGASNDISAATMGSVIIGGDANSISSGLTWAQDYSAIIGGHSNQIGIASSAATSQLGSYSFGSQNTITNDRVLLINMTPYPLNSTVANSVDLEARGGVAINTNVNSTYSLNVGGKINVGDNYYINGVPLGGNGISGVAGLYQNTFSKLWATNGAGFGTNYNGLWTNKLSGEFVNCSSGYKLLMPGQWQIGAGTTYTNLNFYVMVTNDSTAVIGVANYPGYSSSTLLGDYTWPAQQNISVSEYTNNPIPIVLSVTQRSTTTTITNGTMAGTWILSLQLNDAVTGTPAFVVRRPGLGTNTLTPISNLVAVTTTNIWTFPVNPNTTNSVTDVSGTGASVSVVDSHIEQ